MRRFLSLLLLTIPTLLLSCDEDKQAQDPADHKDYFSSVEASLSVASLKNEMATAETEFLRSFADHRIAWQKWDKGILAKSKSLQLPIFAFVGSALGGASILVAEEFEAKDDLRLMLSEKAVCTVIDINAYPEIATLGFHLSTEIRRTTAFPMLIWLSHEGAPLAWIPIGETSGNSLKMVIDNATAMVDDTLEKNSRYAVENSRRDNEARQNRFDLKAIEPSSELREEVFRRETRQLSSLHSSGDQDLDSIGGLIPYSSLELLAIGSCSNLLTNEVRERCREASQSVVAGLLGGALKDQLDGSYFYARRTTDWSLPAFSKNISSQAKVASMLFKVGGIFDDARIKAEALTLLQLIESKWLAQTLSCRSPIGDVDISGGFLWNFNTLRKVLTEEELALAKTAFSLNTSGNIPIEVDPLGNYFELNSLTNRVSIAQIAEKHSLTEEEVITSLQPIKEKLLAYREENTRFVSEKTLTVSDLSGVLKAQVARACHTADEGHLEIAEATADGLLKTYWIPGEGLIRFKNGEQTIPARGTDYMETSLALLCLYQRTLEERWFNAALEIMECALATLVGETDLVAETPPDERIIPIRQHNVSMIFGESTLGLADAAANRLYALTGKKHFSALLDTHINIMIPMVQKSVVNHTDFIVSCALGEDPLVAVLRGNPQSAAGKALLSLLNAPERLSFLTVRPESGSAKLSPLPELPSKNDEASVVLIRSNQSLGQASTPEKLGELLDSIISDK